MKTPKHSTPVAPKAKSVNPDSSKKPKWFDEYTDLMTFKQHPVHDVYIERLAMELMRWVTEEEKVLSLHEFTVKKGIPYVDFLRFVKRNDKLALAHQEAKMTLAVRRENGAIRKEFDAGMVYKSLPMYSTEWKENIEWQSNLKQKEVQEQKQTIVVLEKFPEKS